MIENLFQSFYLLEFVYVSLAFNEARTSKRNSSLTKNVFELEEIVHTMRSVSAALFESMFEKILNSVIFYFFMADVFRRMQRETCSAFAQPTQPSPAGG